MRASVLLLVLLAAGCGGQDTMPTDAEVREPDPKEAVMDASDTMDLAPIVPDSASVE